MGFTLSSVVKKPLRSSEGQTLSLPECEQLMFITSQASRFCPELSSRSHMTRINRTHLIYSVYVDESTYSQQLSNRQEVIGHLTVGYTITHEVIPLSQNGQVLNYSSHDSLCFVTSSSVISSLCHQKTQPHTRTHTWPHPFCSDKLNHFLFTRAKFSAALSDWSMTSFWP